MGQTDPVVLQTFDGGHRLATRVTRPERYRQLRELPAEFTVRGGGYSYAPASFATDRPVVDFTAFNRILRFDPTALEVDVEAGITLGQLLGFLAPRGYWCPVIPGYPAITVGGCIAGDVHGKSQPLHGNFRHWAKTLWLLEPGAGLRAYDATSDPELFNLTCGGLGLTGLIARATLRLVPLPGGQVITHGQPVRDLKDAYGVLREAGATNEFAYSWHRPWCAGDRRLGPGFVFHGSTAPGSPRPEPGDFAFRPLAPDAADRWLPLAVFGGPGNWRTRCVYWGANLIETSKGMMTESLFGSLFPFVRQALYFQLFGRSGMQEVQVLVPHGAAESFIDDLTALSRALCPPASVIALKLFQGEPGGIRFDGEGLCIAIDLVRSPTTFAFLARFDQLCVRHHARPNPLKDSRLGREVFDACCPSADEFRRALRRRGLAGKYSSTLSQRLGLA
jgi:decaprenylphospho-beta-D-ribofuranose 2-oxidase